MNNLKIGFLLHFYQPWWQFPHVLNEIANQCYRPILRIIENAPGFCFSANINYSLLELLARDIKNEDIIEGFKKAVESGKIELLGSTAYHPILPLIPKDARMKQMEVDANLKRTRWGIEKNCSGVFLPEMAFSMSILESLISAGYKWSVLDDEVFRLEHNNLVPYSSVVSLGNFKTLLRSNYWSNRIAGGDLVSFCDMASRMEIEIPNWTKNQPAYLILSLDAETFGHHHRYLIEKFLEPMIKIWGKEGFNILTPLEEIGNFFQLWNLPAIADTSWAVSLNDFRDKEYFPLWNSKHNIYQKYLWQLIDTALQYRETSGARWDCLKIVSSCHWWWISRRPWWNPEFMKFGAIKAMDIINSCGTFEEKYNAGKIFYRLMALK